MDVLFRVDGTARTGAGHVMRCLALASAVRRDGGRAIFVGNYLPGIIRRLRAEGMFVLETANSESGTFVAHLEEVAASSGQRPWVVLDGYEFDVCMQRAVRAAGYPLLVIDDCADRKEYEADVILNQNTHAPSLSYSSNTDATLLLGSKYVLLRPEFTRYPRRDRDVPPLASNVLVSFGAADPAELTPRIARILLEIPGLKPLFVVGPAVDATTIPGATDRARYAPANMRPLMEWADLAIVAAGSTVWELAYLSVPMIVFVVAENQRPIARGLADAGIAVDLGDPAQVSDGEVLAQVTALLGDANRRRRMSERGSLLVDGAGAERTLAALRARSTPVHD